MPARRKANDAMKHTPRRSLALAVTLALAFTASLATPAFADDASTQAVHTEVQHGHAVYVIPTQVVHGEIQRPYQFNVDGRSAPRYSGTEGSEQFTHEVVNAVRHSPF